MNDDVTVRRVGPNEAAACVEALADLLIDCVEGGASVSFMGPLAREKTLVCTQMFEPGEIAEIEKHTEIIDVSEGDAFSGICNSVRLGNTILNASNIHQLKVGTEDYTLELHKNRSLEDIANRLAFDVGYVNLSEFMKGGALLSCMAMHLNRRHYEAAAS